MAKKTTAKTSIIYEMLRAEGLSVSEAALPVIADVVDGYVGRLVDALVDAGEKVTDTAVLKANHKVIDSFKKMEDAVDRNTEEDQKEIDMNLYHRARMLRPETLKFAEHLNEFISDEAKILATHL